MRHVLEVIINVDGEIVVLTKDVQFPSGFYAYPGMEINIKYAFGFKVSHAVFFPQTNAYLLRNDAFSICNREKDFYDEIIQQYKDAGFKEGHIDLTK